MLKKRLPSVKGRKPYIRYHLLQHTLRNRIYMSSFNARKRRHLQILRCSGRNSEVIFHSFLLIPDFHHLRLALTFQNCVLSSSTSLKLSNCLYYNSQNRALSSIISTKPPFLCILLLHLSSQKCCCRLRQFLFHFTHFSFFIRIQ